MAREGLEPLILTVARELPPDLPLDDRALGVSAIERQLRHHLSDRTTVVHRGASYGGCLPRVGEIYLFDEGVCHLGIREPARERAKPGLIRSLQDDDVGLRRMRGLGTGRVGNLRCGEPLGEIGARDDVGRGVETRAGVNGSSDACSQDTHVRFAVKTFVPLDTLPGQAHHGASRWEETWSTGKLAQQ